MRRVRPMNSLAALQAKMTRWEPQSVAASDHISTTTLLNLVKPFRVPRHSGDLIILEYF